MHGTSTAAVGRAASTLGVEEEYHLLEPDTLDLARRPALTVQAEQHVSGSSLRPEMLTSQLEAATDICTDLEQVRTSVVAMRAEAARAAAEHGALLLATSTHPFSLLEQVEIAPRARYDRLRERFAGVVGEFNLCGCHVHVAIPDLDVAVAVMNHARPYLPVLAALTASSPFHEGRDTGYQSARLARLALWPQGGIPPYLRSAQDYERLVDSLVATGMVGEPSELLWELRPSTRYPTLEFRIADTCPDIDDVVLYAGLVRSLVRTLLGRVADATPAPQLADSILVALRWRAARHGLTGHLWSVRQEALMPAPAVVGELWRELEPDLLRHGEHHMLRVLLRQLLRRGTSASRQRRILAEAGSLGDVVRDGVGLTMAGAGAPDGATTALTPARP
jgi:glutamate---cysteine ligase / carboxylate-amine ligase